MPRYVIERRIPEIGASPAPALRSASRTSCDAIRAVGPEIQWLHSYVVDDQTYCVYIAPNEELIREHARRSGFPADRIAEVKAVIDPTTAE